MGVLWQLAYLDSLEVRAVADDEEEKNASKNFV